MSNKSDYNPDDLKREYELGMLRYNITSILQYIREIKLDSTNKSVWLEARPIGFLLTLKSTKILGAIFQEDGKANGGTDIETVVSGTLKIYELGVWIFNELFNNPEYKNCKCYCDKEFPSKKEFVYGIDYANDKDYTAIFRIDKSIGTISVIDETNLCHECNENEITHSPQNLCESCFKTIFKVREDIPDHVICTMIESDNKCTFPNCSCIIRKPKI